MKSAIIALFSAVLLAGCCSQCHICRDIPDSSKIDGVKPLATFYVQNASYLLFGCIPLVSGVNWVEDEIPYEECNDWRLNMFSDTTSLDNNILTLKRACREVGTNRIALLESNIHEDSTWSMCLVKRKLLKTSCFIMPPKTKNVALPGAKAK